MTKPGRLLEGGLSQILLVEVSLGTNFLGGNLVIYVFNTWQILYKLKCFRSLRF